MITTKEQAVVSGLTPWDKFLSFFGVKTAVNHNKALHTANNAIMLRVQVRTKAQELVSAIKELDAHLDREQ